jgi:DNA-binding CsgD family transcriptional regulator
MHNRIVVIHRSDIIRKGIEAIVRENFQCPVKTYPAFSKRLSHHSANTHVLIMADEENAKMIQDASLHTKKNITLLEITDQKAATHENQVSIHMDVEFLSEKIQRVFTGDSVDKKLSSAGELSCREREILALVAKGYANKKIADSLFISPHTVISHRKNITEKLGIKTISGLTVYAVINGIIDLGQISRDDLI